MSHSASCDAIRVTHVVDRGRPPPAYPLTQLYQAPLRRLGTYRQDIDLNTPWEICLYIGVRIQHLPASIGVRIAVRWGCTAERGRRVWVACGWLQCVCARSRLALVLLWLGACECGRVVMSHHRFSSLQV